ncbi:MULTISPECIES: amphi-Trp domain-containing protein [unclassified Marinobacter]|uniref:amphi-Trp domain-containing protein n=1 Tax=unclassified Marinobacter TaxID=83889 RepID=UPI0026E20802|nr:MULTISPECIES: amphi-Trp domain-containing protein [unclassified Marinobacter]MDO6443388.1 amphi-Trp domain-containing protein [Marinobacter sp. 2_MG-2023]MDO6824214.1 amphi-Trp domain-containing protein [Marinobacter sp. 1_MG-2023]
MKSKTKFSHDSLLDRQSTKELLEALGRAIKKGQLEFQESEGDLVLSPKNLLQVSVRASDEGDKQEVEIRLKWRTKAKEISDTPPKIK